MGGSSSASSDAQQTTVSSAGASSPVAGHDQAINAANGTLYNLGANSKFDASPVVVQSALNSIASVVDSAIAAVRAAGQNIAQNNDANNAGQAALLSQVLGASQAQSALTSSGGQTEQNKTILYVVGAALAALVAVMIFRKN